MKNLDLVFRSGIDRYLDATSSLSTMYVNRFINKTNATNEPLLPIS